ncbi:YciI family protein [Thiosocius teredinicola]|uniref:YciI family protein n=1 Tax=Thiosocius teredinicola TaxID=1973002 RepID=UPI000990E41A
MAYLLLILEPHGQRAARTPDEGKKAYAQMEKFAEGLAEKGLLRASQSLSADREGVRVTVHDGEKRLIDGPFTESKEMIGGFFLLDNVSKEQAVEIAVQCPAAAWATVEVRELAPCYR